MGWQVLKQRAAPLLGVPGREHAVTVKASGGLGRRPKLHLQLRSQHLMVYACVAYPRRPRSETVVIPVSQARGIRM